MKVTNLTVWEELGSMQREWSELAAECDASPFDWPSYCIPWWYEMGWGRLLSVAVEEAGLLVGLALVHDRVGDVGRHALRFVGEDVGTYHHLLVAEGRNDVTALLWERLLSTGGGFDFSSVPTEIAQSYSAVAPNSLELVERDPCFVTVPIDRIQSSPKSDVGAVHKATSSAECLDLLTGPREAARWRSGKPGSPTAAFFASAVDASFRTGRLTLHVEDHHDGPVDGLLVLHGSETSAVWRHAGRLGSGPDSPLVQAAMLEAAERGSHRLIWPDSAGVLGKPFSLTDITRVRRKGGRLRELPELARSFVRGFRNYGSA